MYKAVVLALLLGLTLGASAQNFSEWWQQKKTRMKYLHQQLAALTTLEKIVSDGYEMAAHGIEDIDLIRHGEYLRHLRFFSSLEEINPILQSLMPPANSRDSQIAMTTTPGILKMNDGQRISRIRTRLSEILNEYAWILEYRHALDIEAANRNKMLAEQRYLKTILQ